MSLPLGVQVDILGLMLSGQPFQTSHTHPGTGEPVSVWRDADGKFFSGETLKTWESQSVARNTIVEATQASFKDTLGTDRDQVMGAMMGLPSPIDVVKEGWSWIQAIGKTFADRPINSLIETVFPMTIMTAAAAITITSPLGIGVATSLGGLTMGTKMVQSMPRLAKALDYGLETLERAGEALTPRFANNAHNVAAYFGETLVQRLGLFSIFEVARLSFLGLSGIPSSLIDAKTTVDAKNKAADFVAYYAQKGEDISLDEAELIARAGLNPQKNEDVPKISQLEKNLDSKNIGFSEVNKALDRLESNPNAKAFGRNSMTQRLKELANEDLSKEGVSWRLGVIAAEIKYGEDIDDLSEHHNLLQKAIDAPWEAIRGFIPLYRFGDLALRDVELQKQEADQKIEEILEKAANGKKRTSVFTSDALAGADEDKLKKTISELERFNAGNIVRLKKGGEFYAMTQKGVISVAKKGTLQGDYLNKRKALYHEYGHLIEVRNGKGREGVDYINEREIADIEMTGITGDFNLISVSSNVSEKIQRFIQAPKDKYRYAQNDKTLHFTDFKDAYTGVEYNDIRERRNMLGEVISRRRQSAWQTEVLSVGMEHLINGTSAARFAQEDREHMLYTLQAIEN